MHTRRCAGDGPRPGVVGLYSRRLHLAHVDDPHLPEALPLPCTPPHSSQPAQSHTAEDRGRTAKGWGQEEQEV
eukprot:1976959-Rhodomonas_salina.2